MQVCPARLSAMATLAAVKNVAGACTGRQRSELAYGPDRKLSASSVTRDSGSEARARATLTVAAAAAGARKARAPEAADSDHDYSYLDSMMRFETQITLAGGGTQAAQWPGRQAGERRRRFSEPPHGVQVIRTIITVINNMTRLS